MKQLGLLLLTIGFAASAFVAVRQTDDAGLDWQTIDWKMYTASLLVGLFGVVFLRLSNKSEAGHTRKVDANIMTLGDSIARLLDKLRSFIQNRESIGVYEIHERIDDELVEDLGAFADARESMIPRFGLQAYADVMTQFAGGERAINRAWSASADGYIDEVWLSLGRAEAQVAQAKKLLENLSGTTQTAKTN